MEIWFCERRDASVPAIAAPSNPGLRLSQTHDNQKPCPMLNHHAVAQLTLEAAALRDSAMRRDRKPARIALLSGEN